MRWVDLTAGWQNRQDPAKADGLQTMENVYITDRDGIAPRPGTTLLGASDTLNGPINSVWTTVRRDGTNIMLRASDTLLEYYNNDTLTWTTLKSGFTTSQVFGFADHNLNTDATDYLYFCNAVEPYSRWVPAYDKTTALLVGAELVIPVVSTLLSEVYFSGTASASTDTTVTIAASSWAADLWNSGFYVEITAGALQNRISPITATTATQITFTAIAGLAGTVTTFKIRRLKFPATGTAIINSSTVAYTQIIRNNQLPVASAPAAASGSPVAVQPEELISNSCPRGNILKTLFQVMFVAGKKDHPSTIYRSKLQNAADFRYSSPRVAGEGDVIDLPDGGGAISDMDVFEDKLIALKKSYIEQIEFTQDANDLPNRKPLVNSPMIGTDGRVSKMGDEIVFANPSNEITTVARAKQRDQRPYAANLAWPIKRAIRKFSFDESRGKTFRNYTLLAAKETDDSETNDVIVLYDNNRQKWIGKWLIPGADFTIFNNELYAGSSASREVFKLFHTINSTVKGNNAISYDTLCATQWINKTPGGLGTQSFDTIAITGYITDNTPIDFGLYYDFETEARYTWTFDPASSSANILESTGELTLGSTPIGVTPLGIELGEELGDYNERRFVVYYRVPADDHLWTKLQWASTGLNQYYEITDILANFSEQANSPIQTFTKSYEDT